MLKILLIFALIPLAQVGFAQDPNLDDKDAAWMAEGRIPDGCPPHSPAMLLSANTQNGHDKDGDTGTEDTSAQNDSPSDSEMNRMPSQIAELESVGAVVASLQDPFGRPCR